MSRVKSKSKLYASKRKTAKPAPSFRRLSGLFAVLVVLGLAVIFSWRVGWPQRQWNNAMGAVYAASARMGFALDDVIVEGRNYTDKDDIMEALQVTHGMPILAVDSGTALDRLERLPWLHGASIERRLPGTLYVRLLERQPLARWQYQNRVHVIDHDGKPILPASARDFADLPLVVGEGADAHALDLTNALTPYPALQKMLHAAVRVGERRWDLILEPNIRVRLPEERPEDGLKRLADLMQNQQILSRNLVAIDLRINGRTILERAQDSDNTDAKTASGGAPKTL